MKYGILDLMNADQQIKQSLTFVDVIKLLADPLDMVVVVTDAELKSPGPHVLYTNPAYEKMTGYTPEEAIGNSPRMLQGERTNKVLLKQLTRALGSGKHARTCVINYRKNGEMYHCDIAAWPIVDDKGEVTHFIALEREVERKRGRPPKDPIQVPWWLESLVGAQA